MASQVSYKTGNDNILRRAYAGGVNIRLAQTFTPSSSFVITSVSLLLGRMVNLSSGTASILFYTVDVNGKPDTYLGSVGFGANTLTPYTFEEGLFTYESATATSITSASLASNFPDDDTLNGRLILVPDSDLYGPGLALITDYVGGTGTCIFEGLDTGGTPYDSLGDITLSGSDLPRTAWKEVAKGTQVFSAGTKYAIVFSCTAAVCTRSQFPYWALDTNGGYDGGNALISLDEGSSWSNLSGDFLFEIFGDLTLPSKPINPTPENEGSGVSLSATTVTWEDGGGATSYNVYFGTLSGFLTLVEEGVEATEIALIEGNFDHYGEIYYWRVDAVNAAGTTQGDEWVFTALIFNPVLPTGITLIDEEPTGDPTGENNMITVKRLVAAANSKIWYESL